MKKLLIFVDWFSPGYKAGGQIQSCVNLAMALRESMEVYVVTTDRDLSESQPYSSITPDQWNLFNNIRVLYLSPSNVRYATVKKVIHEVGPDCIYLNSMFSLHFTIMPLMACNGARNRKKIVLAPRGMLHKGALQFKSIKKIVFLKAFRLLRFHKKVVFHATDEIEKHDIQKVFGRNANVQLVHDFPGSSQQPLAPAEKEQGSLSCIFISRISPKKNLLYLLNLLQKVNANLLLTIAGPVENEAYWKQCMASIGNCPPNITINYMGPVPNHELPRLYARHHLFVLPTFGENFGHVIFDSFLNGRPVLISDQTPWKNLAENMLGWELDLGEEKKFIAAIEEAASWDQTRFDLYCRNAWHFAGEYLANLSLKNDYIKLFS